MDNDNHPYILKFANNLKFLRKIKDVSQRELSLQLRVSQATISQYESGKLNPELQIIFDICKYFRIKIDDILEKNLNIVNFREFIYDMSFYQDGSEEQNYQDISFAYYIQAMKRFSNNIYYFYWYDTGEDESDIIRRGTLEISDMKNSQYINVKADFGRPYSGTLIFYPPKYMYIDLNNVDRGEKCLIIFEYHHSSKFDKYIGGLGCTLSISTGFDIKPCFQNVLISEIEITGNELAKLKSILNMKVGKMDMLEFSSNIKIENGEIRVNKLYFDSELDKRIYQEIKHIRDNK
jgi:DNA-binding XRE family transcriptional regulator